MKGYEKLVRERRVIDFRLSCPECFGLKNSNKGGAKESNKGCSSSIEECTECWKEALEKEY